MIVCCHGEAKEFLTNKADTVEKEKIKESIVAKRLVCGQASGSLVLNCTVVAGVVVVVCIVVFL